MTALVESINAELIAFAPDHINDPKKAIYRIYRDTRFSSDKTPYKTHIDAIFPRRGSVSKHAGPGFYFSLSPKEVGIAGGVYMAQPDEVLAIRTWLAENHEAFREAAKGPEKLVGKLRGSSLQRAPKGFPADHPAVDLLKMKQWLYYTTIDGKLLATPKLQGEIVKRFRAMTPVLAMLAEALSSSRRRSPAAMERLL